MQDNDDALIDLLKLHDISPTSQRLEIARILLARPQHLSADQVLASVNASLPVVSKATVYNTLGLFAKKGLVREVIVDPSKVFYDSNVEPHFHFYNTDSGELTDIPNDSIKLSQIPDMPKGCSLDSVDVIVRIRQD